MLSSAEFKEWGKSVVLFAHVTSRVQGEKYSTLLQEKGGTGFPYLVALDKDGEISAKATGGRDVEGFTAMMASAKKYGDLKGKADKSTEDQLFLLTHGISLGNLDLAQAKEKIAGLGELDGAQKKSVDGALLGLEIKAALPKRRGDKEAGLAAGKTFADMFNAGREPTTDEAAQPFFILMLDYAEAEKDADLFERALGKLKERFESPRAKRFFDTQNTRLEKLRGASDE